MAKNMDEVANLLITLDPINYGEARAEVVNVLKEVGEHKLEFLYSGVRGLFQVRVDTNPRDVRARTLPNSLILDLPSGPTEMEKP